MTLCEEIQKAAAGLASLDDSDPERRGTYEHAAGCAACRAALNEGDRLMTLIDRELATLQEQVGAEVMARVSREILTSFDGVAAMGGIRVAGDAPLPTSGGRSSSGPRRLLGPNVVIPAVLMGLWVAKMLPHDLSLTNLGGRVSAALAALVVGAVVAAMTLGGAFLATPAGVSILMSVVAGGASGAQVSVGLKCAAFELMFAVVPLALAAIYARRGRFSKPRVMLAIAAGGGSLIAQAVLHVACYAIPSTMHNLFFHTGPVLLAASMGALVGSRIRRRPA